MPPGAGPDNPERGLYADLERGLHMVRGENVLLLGEIDLDKDDEPPPGYDLAAADLVRPLAKQIRRDELAREKAKAGKLAKIGFECENLGEILI